MTVSKSGARSLKQFKLRRSPQQASVIVALVAIASISFLVSRSLSQADWDPSLYAAFGEDAHLTTNYAEERLGDVYLRPAAGHDGKFFFVQANDPWVLNPNNHAAVIHRPLYRSQRMLYPTIAGGFGLFGPEQVIWALLVVNVLSFGLGSFATAEVARGLGMSPWWGLSFTLNFGLISELNIDGAGVVAAAAAFASVALFQRERFGWAIGTLVLAVLSREVMLIVALGIATWLWKYALNRRLAILSASLPLAAATIWGLYLRLRLGWEAGVSEVQEVGLPFVGFFEATAGWVETSRSLDLLVGLIVMGLLAMFTLRVLRTQTLLGWAFLGFAALGILFTEQVWSWYFDISRAVAPIITAYVLLLFVPQDAHYVGRGSQRTGVRF